MGEVGACQAVLFALTLGALAMFVLWRLVNPLTALLTFISLIGYAVIYTMFLKRRTPQNIVLGGAAGAAPPVLGWTAVTGQIHPEALLLFLIIFVWTPPHFWSLAIRRRDRAGHRVPAFRIGTVSHRFRRAGDEDLRVLDPVPEPAVRVPASGPLCTTVPAGVTRRR
jgi:hypothetical protein